MRKHFSSVVDGILALTCLAVLGLLVRRELARPAIAETGAEAGEFVRNWEALIPYGIRIGPSNAKVTILELGDLECPACRLFNARLAEMRKADGNDIALVVLHYPLPMHRFAASASRARECAAAQNRAQELLDLVYEKQDSLGLKSWPSFAREAQLDSPDDLQECVTGSRTFPRIAQGLHIGNRLRIRGTPTIFVNGWRLRADESFASALRTIREGKRPYDKFATSTVSLDSLLLIR